MFVPQGNRGIPPEFGARPIAEFRRELWSSLVVEGHECAVECGVPQSRQEKAVMDVEPFGIALTIGPGNDVRGKQHVDHGRHLARRLHVSCSWQVGRFGSTAPNKPLTGGGVVLAGTANGLLSADTKARIVYWRWSNPLPGNFAFSRYAERDARIDTAALRRAVGDWPSDPRQQNAVWYRLYKRFEHEPAVIDVHRHFLFACGHAAIGSLMFAANPRTADAVRTLQGWGRRNQWVGGRPDRESAKLG